MKCLKKNQSTPRHSEQPPVMGEKMCSLLTTEYCRAHNRVLQLVLGGQSEARHLKTVVSCLFLYTPKSLSRHSSPWASWPRLKSEKAAHRQPQQNNVITNNNHSALLFFNGIIGEHLR